MSSRHVQYFLASIFIVLGSWCVVAPAMAESLGFRPEYQHQSLTSHLLIGCFGAQAVLVGTVVATARFQPHTFLIFGLVGSVPFFVFNWYFYYVAQMFTDWMLLDFAGNIGILACGLIGCRLRRRKIAEATA